MKKRNIIIIIIVVIVVIVSAFTVINLTWIKEEQKDNVISKEEKEPVITYKDCALFEGFNKEQTRYYYKYVKIELYDGLVHAYSNFNQIAYINKNDFIADKDLYKDSVTYRDEALEVYQPDGDKVELEKDANYQDFIKSYLDNDYMCEE
ncbi:MAG: hypothetical protein ACI31M_02265 [Bacilli bacterium]